MTLLFAPFYLSVLALVAAELAFGRRSTAPRTPDIPPLFSIVALVVTYVVQLALVWHAATHQSPALSFQAELPIPFVKRTAEALPAISAAMIATALVQSLALLALYRKAPGWPIVAGAAAVLAVLSVAEPAMIRSDAYAYVGDAALGRAAYMPPAKAFQGPLSVVNAEWGMPLRPTPYGPLWIAVSSAVMAPFPSLYAKILALRCLGLTMVVATVGGLWLLGFPNRMLAIAALNPALFLQFVVDAHNDIVAVSLVILAAIFVKRGWLVACSLGILSAALIKIPFAILGLPVLIGLKDSWKRVVASVGVVALAPLLTWLVVGANFWGAIARHAPVASLSGVLYSGPLGGLVSIVGLAVIVVSIFYVRRIRSAVWLMPFMGTVAFPWYMVWGTGYALRSRRSLAYLLVWLPFAAMIVDSMFVQLWTILIILPAIVSIAILRSVRTA